MALSAQDFQVFDEMLDRRFKSHQEAVDIKLGAIEEKIDTVDERAERIETQARITNGAVANLKEFKIRTEAIDEERARVAATAAAATAAALVESGQRRSIRLSSWQLWTAITFGGSGIIYTVLHIFHVL